MKRMRSPCPSPHGDSDTEKLSFSRSEVEKMIDEAVLSAGIGCEERYEAALYKLEDHIKKMKRRGNAAFTYIRKLGISSAPVNKQDKSQLPSPAVAVKVDRGVLWASVGCFQPSSAEKPPCPLPRHIPDPYPSCTKSSSSSPCTSRSSSSGGHTSHRSEDDTMSMELHDKTHRKSLEDNRELLYTLDNRKESMQAMQADTEAMKTIICKMKEEPLSPTRQSTLSDTPHSLQSNFQDWIKEENVSAGHSPNHEKMQVEDEEHKPLWTQDIESQMDYCNYPPFPVTPFPLVLNWEAASYNIPQAPIITSAITMDPPGLNIHWNIEEKDALTIDSYSVFRTVEDAKGSGVFKEWEKVNEVEARDVPRIGPIYLSETKLLTCRSDYKVCFTVVGKDKFGRYGPYSNIVSKTHPALSFLAV